MYETDPHQNNKKKRFWIITGCIFVALFLLLGSVAYFLAADFYPAVFGEVKKPKVFELAKKSISADLCAGCARRAIDGVYAEAELVNLYPAAVIIENNIDSRPSSALAKANLVFEAEAEGGITRFLAVYAAGEDIDEIGPIRSARPYFVDWARELSALFIHCGGSPEALIKIARDNIFSINEFYNETFFWRDKHRAAPHNIYTSTENINKYLAKKEAGEGMLLSWHFKDDAPEDERTDSAQVKIGYKTNYEVEWIYNKKTNDYIRYLAGQRHKDSNGDEIRAKNIIVQYVKAKVLDDEGRLKMEHIGSGKALACLDGKCAAGEWRKDKSSARTRFYNEGGEEFEFNSGVTWVEVVRPEIELSIAN
ncbi:DUF3048 domain-containing protein [Patescibacteria group bacterium]|nr:DUF3048 domain-containing protein [Patescibacteria group bacterium]MBU4601032.1 DUF3048 domain-containing protein [Patescibacteria group bacterium]